jgi:RNA polymerase sigma-70 factor (ECF subfamily)
VRDDTFSKIRQCLSRLNEKHGKVITLIDLLDFSYEEAADTLDVPIGTVMSRLFRARQQLRGLLMHQSIGGKSLLNAGV